MVNNNTVFNGDILHSESDLYTFALECQIIPTNIISPLYALYSDVIPDGDRDHIDLPKYVVN